MRLAYFSPLPPAQSGIADYSAELLPYLARGADVDVYVDDAGPAPAVLPTAIRVLPAGRFAAEARSRPYTSTIYQLGNSSAHAYSYARLLATPGVVVLHELVLHDLRAELALRAGGRRAYRQLMAAVYGAAGAAAAEQILQGGHPDLPFAFPLVEEALAHATGVIVHSAYLAGEVRRLRPVLPLAVVPMGVPLPPLVDPAVARARLGLDPDLFILASLGHLNPHKRLDVALRAFKACTLLHPRSLFLFAGSRSPEYDVAGRITRLGLAAHARVLGYAPPAQFADVLAAADVCVNLRAPTAGETSAALLRIMGAGKPVLVSRAGAFAELPDATVVKVDVGGIEEALLLDYLLLLAARPDLRRALGAAARAYVAAQHTLAGAAQRYLAFVTSLTGRAENAAPDHRGHDAPGRADTAVRPYASGMAAGLAGAQDVAANPDGPGAPGRADTAVRPYESAGLPADTASSPDAPGAPGRADTSVRPYELAVILADPAAGPAAIQNPKSKIQNAAEPLGAVAAAAAACGLAPDDPALAVLVGRLSGLL